MELHFETKPISYLSETIFEQICQEETAESIVPDSYPDVEKILGATAHVVLRGKDSQAGYLQISGAVLAKVLYNPEDYGAPKTLDFYIPFTMKTKSTTAEDCLVNCYVEHVDARMINSRKVLLRANLVGAISGYNQIEETQYTYTPENQGDLQLQTNRYTMVCPVELGEKPFTVSDDLELPSGQPPLEVLYQYQVKPQILETKLMGNKGVFKGSISGKILYGNQEKFHTWSWELPFSQYVELEHTYDQEELEVVPMMTDLQLDAVGQGGVSVHVQMLAQCTVVGKTQMETVEDAYSLNSTFMPQWSQMSSWGRLDHQTMQQVVRTTVACPAKEVVDTQLYLGRPAVEPKGSGREIRIPIQGTVLYLDDQEQLDSRYMTAESTFHIDMNEDCICRPTSSVTGEIFGLVAGDGLEIRCPMGLTVDTWVTQDLQTLCGGELEACYEKQVLPSVILKPVQETDTLWSIAKSCRTTQTAICQANNFEDLESFQGNMLIIPISAR